ncbi:hypothetical protein GCM10009821_23450 [Aeromicrobium halocynthiae]|uniref:DUF1795 domain-containing protein n=1 Tax=Aeromicrobium halocynthiae TaxID=560557 RepID=A0ABN2W2I9_9ACTN
MTSRSLRAMTAAVAASLVLVACGGSDDTESGNGNGNGASSSVEPASGGQTQTDEFTFTAPDGWEDVVDQMDGFDPEAAWADPEPEGDFATNLNVIREPNGFDGDTEEYVEANLRSLEAAGFADLTEAGTFGDFAVVTAGAEQNGVSYLVNQYYAARDGNGWVVTFSFPEGTSDAERTELAESVMQTWEWA